MDIYPLTCVRADMYDIHDRPDKSSDMFRDAHKFPLTALASGRQEIESALRRDVRFFAESNGDCQKQKRKPGRTHAEG
jgi:hypothetical protein